MVKHLKKFAQCFPSYPMLGSWHICWTTSQADVFFRNSGEQITQVEKRAWSAFKNVFAGFLGNNKAENDKDLIEELLNSYYGLGCRMSLKLHYLHSHLKFFRPNLGAVTEESGDVEHIPRKMG